ncbi:hypothetical protein Tco_0471481 [Tanacetum coccineum]|uniref:Uncharacterized protein n=1 Tax=Tanacetum coccineum TaxID=301880 RepID=A0ABQ5HE21_9ASTR
MGFCTRYIHTTSTLAVTSQIATLAIRVKLDCNLRLSSDVTSKEATLQVVYDVLKLTPFYKAFQVTADAPEIYMQEFWASAYVHNRSVDFKMNNKKSNIIVLSNSGTFFKFALKSLIRSLCPPLEKEDHLFFLASLGHSGDIWKDHDVNVNRTASTLEIIAAVTQQMSSGTLIYDVSVLSSSDLWGMYNKKNVDYAYLLWEDFIYKIENKSTMKGNKGIARRKLIQMAIPKLKPPNAPKEKKSEKDKQKCANGRTISEADL